MRQSCRGGGVVFRAALFELLASLVNVRGEGEKVQSQPKRGCGWSGGIGQFIDNTVRRNRRSNTTRRTVWNYELSSAARFVRR